MSLDVYLDCSCCRVQLFTANVTHNLGGMAEAAGLYKSMWRPEEIGCATAADLVPLLEAGIAKLVAEPERFRTMNPPNGWGSYEGLLNAAQEYAAACKAYPSAKVHVSR